MSEVDNILPDESDVMKSLADEADDLDIQVVDFNDVLSNQENPLSYFPFELPNHYTNEGYALLANQINETLKNNN